ncbi:hypothetical protein LKL24_08500 [Bacillus halotolerans]|uniref:hypothetical protein n=1 Tax=Bacillus halotolerans TaxID=260554 RepID=UPI001D0EBE02|nr:hypothetical protein [Bacillus halotolerans]MCC2527452.1 hypothetical protein [Bacillus halotolerans]
MDFLYILVESVIWILITSIPSKRNLKFRRNLKTLKKHAWFRNLMKDYRPLFLMNSTIQNKIIEYNENIDSKTFKMELEQLAKNI